MKPRIKLTTYEGSHFIVNPDEIAGIQITCSHSSYGKTLPNGDKREYTLLNKIIMPGGHIVIVRECLSDIEDLIKFATKENYVPYAAFELVYDEAGNCKRYIQLSDIAK